MNPIAIGALLAFLAGASVSGAAVYNIYRAKMLAAQVQIEQERAEQAELLSSATSKILTLEREAQNANDELDAANEAAVKTINTYYDNLNDTIAHRLRDKQNQECRPIPVPKSPSAASTEHQAGNGTDFSQELGRFLSTEFERADKLAIYARDCHTFVTNNCGIKP